MKNPFDPLNAAAAEVREHQGCSAFRALAALLDEVEKLNLESLRTILPEQLSRKQGELRQVEVLRALISGDPNNNGMP